MSNNVPAGAALLLAHIRRIETGADDNDAYRTIYGHKETRLPKPLTQYTIKELLEAQKLWAKNWRGSAAGAYQIIRKTLVGLVAEMGIAETARFTPELQDAMGYHLLRRRGWEAFAQGRATVRVFGHSLAREWASLPVLADGNGAHRKVRRGQSYYAGDGLNKALMSADAFEAILAEARKLATRPVQTEQPRPAPVPAPEPVSPRHEAPIEEYEEALAPRDQKRRRFPWPVVLALLAVAALAAFGLWPTGE